MTEAARLRRVMRGVALALCVGVPLELALGEHWGAPVQLLPFVACAIGAAAVLSGRFERPAFAGVAAVGLFGVWEHVEHNALFFQEIQPSAGALDVAVAAVAGANPALAPLVLLVVAALGYAARPALAAQAPDGG